MNDSTEQSISSLVDGEVDAKECRRISEMLCREQQHRKRWERYHLISDALRSSLPAVMDRELADRIRQAVDREPAILAPKRRVEMNPATRWAAGMAVAASVAAVAVFGVRFSNEDAALGTAQVAQMPASSEFVRLAETPAPVAGVSTVKATGETTLQPQLDQYLFNHHQQAFGSGIQGAMPYARIVTYPTTETQQAGQ
jgi:sigma-E factor negative regulatory protein RseA